MNVPISSPPCECCARLRGDLAAAESLMARMDAFYQKLPPTDDEIAVLLDKYATEENAIYASHETVAEIVEALVKVAQERGRMRVEHERRVADLVEASNRYLDEARAARRAFRLLQEAHTELTVAFGRVAARMKRLRRAGRNRNNSRVQ